MLHLVRNISKESNVCASNIKPQNSIPEIIKKYVLLTMSNEIRSSWMISRLRFGRKWYWPFQDIPIKPKETEEGYEKVTKASSANTFPPLYLEIIPPQQTDRLWCRLCVMNLTVRS